MFGIGMPELIIILVIALIVIGPSKLPELAKTLGKGMAEFRKATQEIKDTLDIEDEIKEAKEDLVDSISGLERPLDLPLSSYEENSADHAKQDKSQENSNGTGGISVTPEDGGKVAAEEKKGTEDE